MYRGLNPLLVRLCLDVQLRHELRGVSAAAGALGSRGNQAEDKTEHGACQPTDHWPRDVTQIRCCGDTHFYSVSSVVSYTIEDNLI